MQIDISSTLDKGYQEHQRGNFASAIEHYERVLTVNPREAEALSLKGLVLCMLKRFAEAEPLLREAVKIEPEQLSFWLNLTECLRQTNRHEEACELLNTHIPSHSASKPAWISLYQSAISTQKIEPAIYALEKLLSIDLDIKVLLSLTNLYVKKQELQTATALILNVIERCRKVDDVWNALCWLLREQGRWQELYQYVSQWLELAPDNKEAWKIQAMVCYELGLQHDAIAAYEHIFTLKDSGDDDWLSYVEICVQTLELDKATTAIETLREKNVVTGGLLNAQVLLAIYAGDKAQGLALCQLCFQKFPQYLPIYNQYSKLKKGNLLPKQVEFLQGCMQSNDVQKQEKTMLTFVLAHDSNAKSNFDTAFGMYTLANKLKSEVNVSRGFVYKKETAEQRVKEIMLNFKKLRAFSGDFATQHVTPIFIVGMPRSGTTLLEGGIASHPDVHMGGERIEFPNLLTEIIQVGHSKDKLTSLLSDFTSQYLEKGKMHKARFITDKNPANYESIGLISILFPKSLIINVERNPQETCFSIFRHEFNHLWPYSTSIADIAHQYKQYQELIGFWQQQTINLLTIKYEELTADFEHNISSIHQKIGIEKYAGDLQHKFNRHTFTTLSALQVRDTVKNKNGLVEQYTAHLDELRNALNLP
jgi:tetratricopeptide (TPR) repeat protein